MHYHNLFMIVLILAIASNPLHAADQEQRSNPDTFPDPELPELIDPDVSLSQQQQPTNWVADYFGLPTEYNRIRSTPFVAYNGIQNNKCKLPECSGPNYSVDPLYKSLAKNGGIPSSYKTAISIRYRFQSDGSIKEEETFNGCSHSFHEACLKAGDACAFCGIIMPLTQHTAKKE